MSPNGHSCIAAGLLALFPLGLHATAPTEGTTTLILGHAKEFRIARGAPTSPEALARDWGQFELLIPRKQFPLAAPACRSDVKLRFIALPPDAPNRDSRVQARWHLLEKLRRIAAGSPDEVRIPLDTRYYVIRKNGHAPVLKYCNSFADEGE